MPKIRSAAKRFGVEVSKESGVTETVTKDIGPDLDGDAEPTTGWTSPPPSPNPKTTPPVTPPTPGSPAWESIDAATAQKWTSVAVRLKNALAVMAEREMVEAATADPDDAGNAFDLEDAMCAIDFAIDTLASFAVGEQAESDLGAEEINAIGKALAGFDPAPLDTLEGFTAVAKAGRVLSSANEARIRDAAASLQNVLASLPSAPQATDSGLVVAKEKEAVVAAATETKAEAAAPETVEKAEEVTALAPNVTRGEAGLPDLPAEPAPAGDAREVAKAALRSAVYVYHGDGTQAGLVDPARIVQQVTKADAPPDGQTVDAGRVRRERQPRRHRRPADITPVAGAGGKADEPEPEAPPWMRPPRSPPLTLVSPPTRSAKPRTSPRPSRPRRRARGQHTPDFVVQVTKSVSEAMQAAFAAQNASHEETVAKQASVIGELTGQIDVLKARVEEIAEQPAAPKVFTNGAVPPAGSLRGQDQGSQPVDVAKAQELKRDPLHGDRAGAEHGVP